MPSESSYLDTLIQNSITFRISSLEKEVQDLKELMEFLDQNPNGSTLLTRFKKVTATMGIK